MKKNKHFLKSKNIWFLGILIIIFTVICFFIGRSLLDKRPTAKREVGNNVSFNGEIVNGDAKTTASTGEIKFAGYSELYVSSSKPYILLSNPQENTVYFTYTIYDSLTEDILLDETDLIEPGTAFQWKASESLNEGENEVYFVIKTYAMTDAQTPRTSAKMTGIPIHAYK